MKKKSFSFLLAILLSFSFGYSQNSKSLDDEKSHSSRMSGTWEVSSQISPVAAYRGAKAAYSNAGQHKLFVFGGWSTTSGFNNETSIYNVNDDSWSTASNVPTNTKGGSAICVNDDIYLACGNNGVENIDTVFKYNIASDTWAQVASYPQSARYCAAAYNYDNGYIYSCGGILGDYTALDNVYVYDPVNDLWDEATPMPYTSTGGSSLIYIENKIFVIGGSLGVEYTKVLIGEIDTNDPLVITWTEGEPIPVEMKKMSAGYIGDSKIIATEQSGTFIYNIAENTWSEADPKPIPVKGANDGSFNMGSNYYFVVAGGKDIDGNFVDHVEYYNNITGQQQQQNFNLNTGYQFVSSYIVEDNMDMLVVLEDILNENLDYVRNSDGNMLRKIGPNWINGIGNWTSTEGYLFKLIAPESFTMEGDQVPTDTPISLQAGYRFASYLPTSSNDAMTAFESIIGDDLDFIRNSGGGTLRKIGPVWVNGIGDANPGEGYLVKMLNPGVLIYPASDAKSTNNTNNSKATHFNFNGGNAADPVYTMYVSGLEVGDEVAVYDGDVMVGSTVIRSDNKFENSLPLFSTLTNEKGYNPGNGISIKVWDSEKQMELVSTYYFESGFEALTDQVFPSNDGEYSFVNVLKGTSGIENTADENVSVYPNPANDNVNIVSNETINVVQVLNFLGQVLLYTEVNDTQMKINTSDYQSGVYIIKINTINATLIKKVTIK